MQGKPPDMTPDLQQADDMLMSMMEQRNAALNENVQLRAQLRASARRIQALEAQVPKAEDTPAAETPKPNGAAAEAVAQ